MSGRLLAGGPALAGHLAACGPLPTARLRPDRRRRRAPDLRGRGGAGFPTAIKLAAVAERRRPVVVVNGTEGEPMSAKDATLLTCAPHLVLDGAVLAARAVGAREILVVAPAHIRLAAAVGRAPGPPHGHRTSSSARPASWPARRRRSSPTSRAARPARA